MRRSIIAAGVLALGMVTTGATMASASTPVNWTARTCRDVAAYGSHPSLRTLESGTLAFRLVTDAAHIPGRSYFKADAEEFGADQATPSKERDKLMDVAFQYLKEDQQSYC